MTVFTAGDDLAVLHFTIRKLFVCSLTRRNRQSFSASFSRIGERIYILLGDRDEQFVATPQQFSLSTLACFRKPRRRQPTHESRWRSPAESILPPPSLKNGRKTIGDSVGQAAHENNFLIVKCKYCKGIACGKTVTNW